MIEYISDDKFLRKIYPNGLVEPICIGRISLTAFGDTRFSVYTKQRPAIDIVKWGRWGATYNTVVINLASDSEDEYIFKGWRGAKYLPYTVTESDKGMMFIQEKDES